ncbi:CPBP family intramembrane glutamic endopeptidase [Luteolibacter marinus]|uniref:CPBP family intramembrane glutamic endopeptidase n=1 Tax=Luteolibacter marinus TaxID=2776705 RepID=UPI001868827F|nr:type II CAAX endopeptidase family protein [Luteolibacter marinus]
MAIASSVTAAGTALSAGGADAIIVGTFVAAAVLFVVLAGVRAAMARASVPAPGGQHPLDPVTLGDDASPYAPGRQFPPPLPAVEAAAGIHRWMKIPTSAYRPYDVVLIGLVFLVFFSLTAGSLGTDPTPVEDKFQPPALVASIFFQLMLMAMVMFFVKWRVSLTSWLGLKWRQWPFAMVIAPLTVFFMWCLMGALQLSGWNGWLEESLGIESMQEAVQLLQEAKDPVVIALMAVAAVLVAPLAEEVIFRGYLYPAAKKFCGPAGGIIFSSMVFAAAHANVVALLPLFILAVILCLIYEATGSIWANISVHFLFNAATVALQLLARSGLVDLSQPQ